jgi:hypothetical protein
MDIVDAILCVSLMLSMTVLAISTELGITLVN